MERIIEGDFYKIKFKPLYKDIDFLYEIKKPKGDYKPVYFKTATSNMQLVENNGKIFIEHLNVNGKLELIPYKGIHAGDDNFVNIGWSNNKDKKYLRIDIYTGESVLIES